MKMEKYPRDLLQRFLVSSGGSEKIDNRTQTQTQAQQHHQGEEEEEEDEGIELHLGLSLGGRFGVDKHAKNQHLVRSSSIVGTMPLLREDSVAASPAYSTLVRSSSLPSETEEEWRKRKELQTLRRMEAKRRRSEKQRGSKSERDVAGVSSGGGGLEEVEGAGASAITMGLNRLSSSTATPPPFGLPSWGVAGKQVVLGDVLGKGKVGVGFQGLFAQPSSQGSSAESQGGSSSSVSEMDSKPVLGNSFNSALFAVFLPCKLLFGLLISFLACSFIYYHIIFMAY